MHYPPRTPPPVAPSYITPRYTMTYARTPAVADTMGPQYARQNSVPYSTPSSSPTYPISIPPPRQNSMAKAAGMGKEANERTGLERCTTATGQAAVPPPSTIDKSTLNQQTHLGPYYATRSLTNATFLYLLVFVIIILVSRTSLVFYKHTAYKNKLTHVYTYK